MYIVVVPTGHSEGQTDFMDLGTKEIYWLNQNLSSKPYKPLSNFVILTPAHYHS